MRKKNFFEIVVSMILALISFVFSKDINGYGLIYILPFGYVILRLIFRKGYMLEKCNISLKAIHFISFIKYCFMPCIIVLISDYYNGVLTKQIPSSAALEKSIIFILYEMLTVFIIVEVYGILRKKRKKESKQTCARMEIQPIIIITLLIGLGITIIFSNFLLPKQIFVLNESYTKSKNDFFLDGAVLIIYDIFKTVVLLLFLRYCFEKYEQTEKNKYIIYSAIIMVAYIGLLTSTSRWSIVLPVVIYLYLAQKYFKEKIKIIVIVVGTVLVISFLSISAFKFSWLLKNSSSNFLKDMSLMYLQQLQEYFSGPRATAQGIEAIERYREDITIKTLINDYIGSIPMISHYVNQKDRINIYYNYLIKGENVKATQIMPMITVGLAYFGEVFSTFFIIFNLWIALKFGDNENNNEDIFYKYIYAYAGIWFSMSLMFNTQIVFGNYISYFLPMLIVLNMNKYIIIKKRI